MSATGIAGTLSSMNFGRRRSERSVAYRRYFSSKWKWQSVPILRAMWTETPQRCCTLLPGQRLPLRGGSLENASAAALLLGEQAEDERTFRGEKHKLMDSSAAKDSEMNLRTSEAQKREADLRTAPAEAEIFERRTARRKHCPNRSIYTSLPRMFAGAGMLMKVGIPVADLIVSAKERHSSAEIQARFCRNCVYSRLSQASTGTSNGSASKKSFENLIDFLKRVY